MVEIIIRELVIIDTENDLCILNRGGTHVHDLKNKLHHWKTPQQGFLFFNKAKMMLIKLSKSASYSRIRTFLLRAVVMFRYKHFV